MGQGLGGFEKRAGAESGERQPTLLQPGMEDILKTFD
jgi:hypothetical protein